MVNVFLMIFFAITTLPKKLAADFDTIFGGLQYELKLTLHLLVSTVVD